MFVVGLQQAESHPVHGGGHAVVGAVEHAVGVFQQETARGARRDGRFGHAARQIDVEVGVLVQQGAQTLQILVHVQIVAGDERRAGIGRHGAFECGDEFFVVAASLHGGVHRPGGAVQQTVVVAVERTVHPDRFGDVDADGHAQFAAALEQRAELRVVGVDAFARYRIGIEVAQPLVAQFAHAYGAQTVALFELGDGSLGPVGTVEIRVVEAAPEREPLFVGGILFDVGLERLPDPVAVLHVGLLDAAGVHRLDPCADLLFVAGIVVGVDVDGCETRFLHLGNGNAED